MDEIIKSSPVFYPVVHLLTGPPGLSRNGGIWKRIKTDISMLGSPVSLMSQVLHFTMYNLSSKAWNEWNLQSGYNTVILKEMEHTFGPNRDLFLDSGGFQLLYGDKIDLSKWSLNMMQEDILDLQLKFKPQKIASLDAPLLPFIGGRTLKKMIDYTIDNEKILVDRIANETANVLPYLVVHGRTPEEIRSFLNRLFAEIPKKWGRLNEFGLALGSQVPLVSDKARIVSNALEIVRWMKQQDHEVPLHIFGIGDDVAGRIWQSVHIKGGLSYDNSTYVKQAYKLRIFNQETLRYELFNPYTPIKCDCWGCKVLKSLGPDGVESVLMGPSYHTFLLGDRNVTKSDVLAYIALHNISTWDIRFENQLNGVVHKKSPFTPNITGQFDGQMEYFFPISQFKPKSPNLVIIECSKKKPYKTSNLHRRVLKTLNNRNLKEGVNFDRISLSGLYGPVHWKDEGKPAILSYDFSLNNPTVSQAHIKQLRLKTTYVMKAITKKYKKLVAVLTSNSYEKTFGPVLESYGIPVLGEIEGLTDFEF